MLSVSSHVWKGQLSLNAAVTLTFFSHVCAESAGLRSDDTLTAGRLITSDVHVTVYELQKRLSWTLCSFQGSNGDVPA